MSTTKLQIKLAERVDKDDENANMYCIVSRYIVPVEQAIGTAMPFQGVLHNPIQIFKHAEWN